MFPCERCGLCCRSLAGVALAENMVLENGICKFLDEEKNLCRIYSARPIFCNVDAYYEKYLSGCMTREDFYSQNKKICEEIRRQKKCRNE